MYNNLRVFHSRSCSSVRTATYFTVVLESLWGCLVSTLLLVVDTLMLVSSVCHSLVLGTFDSAVATSLL